MRLTRPARAALSLAFVAVTAVGLTACGGSAGADAGDIVVATTIESVTDMTPGGNQGSNIDYALFTPLTRFDNQAGELVNAVAESITSEDQVNWTIKLKDGWTFHDGSPVTAQSFADSWNTTANPANALINNGLMAQFAGYAEMNPLEGEPTATTLSGVKVVDDLTLSVQLISPYRLLPYLLSAAPFAPITEATAQDPKKFATNPIGNGPFKAPQGGWSTSDQDIILERFDDYQGEKAASAAIDLRVYQQTDAIVTDLRAEQIDVATLQDDQLVTAEKALPGQIVDSTPPGVIYLGMPLFNEKFASVDLRRAISLAIDRQAIVDSLLEGNGTAADGLGADTMVGTEGVECEICAYDPDAAKAALEAAGGWDGPMTLTTVTDPTAEKVLQAIANQLRDNLGIDATIQTLPLAQLYESLGNMSAEGPVLLTSTLPYPHLFGQADVLLKTAGLLNVTGFSDPQVDAAVAAAAAADSDEAVATDTATAVNLGLAQAPLAPLYYPKSGVGHSERVGGVEPIAIGGADLSALRTN